MVIPMRTFVWLIVGLLLTGCTYPGGPDCEAMQAVALQAQLGRETTIEQFEAWISETYHVVPKAIRAIRAVDDRNYWTVYWDVTGRTYQAELDNGKVSKSAGMSFERRKPSADQVIACLGTPTLYYARYNWDLGKYALHLYLLFPDQGILASGAKYFYPKPEYVPPIDGDFPIWHLGFGPSGSAEQVLHRIYIENSVSIVPSIPEYKSWPGKWEGIVVEIDPRLRQ